jgi:uncharacterized protein (TIGR02118 family)
MIKLMKFVKRSSGVSINEFRSIWKSNYVDSVQSDKTISSSIRRYVHNLTALESYEDDDPSFDLVEEIWFDDKPTARSVLSSESYRNLDTAIEEVVSEQVNGLTYEVPVETGAVTSEMVKGFGLLHPAEELSTEDFHRYWRYDHTACVTATPSWNKFVNRYVQNHVINYTDDRNTPSFTGIAEAWYDSLRDPYEWQTQPDYEETIVPDERKFMDRSAMESILARPYEII